ncbi:hypothetical protein CHS0354_009924 [Potamilus streckersoni]|uniref:Uncharacterized protein n=1 Tax=Potamilus streckersoni TaxID=2493646 RepID=A0AAE0TE20_9BIVA|nr:hypothetical protein CHS0354_009924 [Potamilus streckersoni]
MRSPVSPIVAKTGIGIGKNSLFRWFIYADDILAERRIFTSKLLTGVTMPTMPEHYGKLDHGSGRLMRDHDAVKTMTINIVRTFEFPTGISAAYTTITCNDVNFNLHYNINYSCNTAPASGFRPGRNASGLVRTKQLYLNL